jgi:hypothetical protein
MNTVNYSCLWFDIIRYDWRIAHYQQPLTAFSRSNVISFVIRQLPGDDERIFLYLNIR